MATSPFHARSLRRWSAIGIGLCWILWGGGARGDGAFPGSSGIIAPASRPHAIIVGTNFGVVSSIDDGQTWTYSCEQADTSFAFQYQLGAPPQARLYAISAAGLVYSDDGACTWSVAGGALAGATVDDVFPDPSSASRVLAIATLAAPDGGAPGVGVFASTDGGKTFGPAVYKATGGDVVTGVEIARSSSSIVYMTLVSSTFVPKLGRSTDGGTGWQVHELATALGADARSVRLIAVDPADSDRLYLRVGTSHGDRLVVSRDGGASARTSLDLPDGVMSAFARASSGALLVTGVVGVAPVAYRSADNGDSFQPLPTPPNLIGLAARGGIVYGVTDTMLEDYALAISTDDGGSWRPFMSYAQIQAIDACAKTQCQPDCQLRAGMEQWPADVCDAVPAPKPVDDDGPSSDGGMPGAGGAAGGAEPGGGGGGGATGGGGGAGGQGRDAAAPDATPDGAAGAKGPSAGCHCAASGGGDSPGGPAVGAVVVLALGLLAARVRGRMARRGGGRPEPAAAKRAS